MISLITTWPTGAGVTELTAADGGTGARYRLAVEVHPDHGELVGAVLQGDEDGPGGDAGPRYRPLDAVELEGLDGQRRRAARRGHIVADDRRI